jgi:DnaJ-class molecular chaperone
VTGEDLTPDTTGSMSVAEWDAWRKDQEWYACSHCGGDGTNDDFDVFQDFDDRCKACNGTGDGRQQTIW